MKHRPGFTVIELVFVVALLAAASVIFFIQKNNLEVTARDSQRKTAINAMYYSLEEVYYKQHSSYPRTLDATALPSIDAALFTDPNGIKLGQTTVTVDDETLTVASDYRYEGTNCSGETCKSYQLRAVLENEDDFVKTSRHN